MLTNSSINFHFKDLNGTEIGLNDLKFMKSNIFAFYLKNNFSNRILNVCKILNLIKN